MHFEKVSSIYCSLWTKTVSRPKHWRITRSQRLHKNLNFATDDMLFVEPRSAKSLPIFTYSVLQANMCLFSCRAGSRLFDQLRPASKLSNNPIILSTLQASYKCQKQQLREFWGREHRAKAEIRQLKKSSTHNWAVEPFSITSFLYRPRPVPAQFRTCEWDYNPRDGPGPLLLHHHRSDAISHVYMGIMEALLLPIWSHAREKEWMGSWNGKLTRSISGTLQATANQISFIPTWN